MANLKIGIMLSCREQSEDLVRRMMEMTAGVDYRIILDGSKECAEADYIITDGIFSENFPVSVLAAEIGRELGEKFRACLRELSDSSARTYVFRSNFGGCGCSAAGLTAARVLAGRSGGRVAFICSDERDIEIYAEKSAGGRSSRELEYLLAHGMNAEPAQYGVTDRYGVTVFTAGRQAAKLTEFLNNQGFSAIVTDAGSRAENRNLTGQAVINVEGWGDSRSADYESRASEEIATGSREFYVLNKAPYRKSGGQYIMIAADDKSFIRNGKVVEIAMDGSFAASISELVTAIEKELNDGQSDFYK